MSLRPSSRWRTPTQSGALWQPEARNSPMRMPNFLREHSRTLSAFLFAILAAASVTGAFLLRFEYSIPAEESTHLWKGICVAIAVRVLVFRIAGCDRGGWRYAGLPDIRKLFFANIAGSIVWTGITYEVVGPNFPRSVYGIELVLSFLATAGARMVVRSIFESVGGPRSRDQKNILIYGAGAAGCTLLKEIRSNVSMGYRVLGFLDDDRSKKGDKVLGVSVLGTGRSAAEIVERFRRRRSKVDEIVIAMPSASGRAMNEAISNCRSSGASCKTIPGVAELLSGKVLTS